VVKDTLARSETDRTPVWAPEEDVMPVASTRSAYGGQRERAIIKRPVTPSMRTPGITTLLITAPVAERATTALPWGRTDT
jgi:hypothetical protein